MLLQRKKMCSGCCGIFEKIADDVWFTSKEAADYLNITPAYLRNLTYQGRVPVCKIGRNNRYLQSELRDLLLKTKKGGSCGY